MGNCFRAGQRAHRGPDSVAHFYIYLAWKQARANDQLIEQLEADPAMAKTHHRKTWPFRPGWQKEIHVWPFLLRIEFLAAIIVTIILMVWSITLNAPLEEPGESQPDHESCEGARGTFLDCRRCWFISIPGLPAW